ncbi:MFS transporter [Nocardioides panaciterrulae]|uniref:MFS family permease n=1 Tax=Nocardioides panaciterrulae TaxID=661492 RepID=A0A7Y9E8I3_9ACTN|nr:MFS family permease [Nocardioides panaciterrulae]
MTGRVRLLLLPDEPVHRALTLATMTAALSTGLFFSVSALYFTRVVGLSPTTVGLGLTIAGGVGVAASFLGGYLADRVGADRLQVAANGLQGLALLAYVFTGSAVTFTAVACFAVGARSLQGSAKAALQARWFTGPERVQVRARLRVVTNVFIGLGTLLAAIALLLGTAAAYRSTMIGTAVLTGAATVPMAGLRRRVPRLAATMAGTRTPEGGRARGRSPLRDRTYLASVALNSVIAMQFGIQTVGVPLWIAGATAAPTVMVSVLMVINTVFVALCQVRASRGTHDIRHAGRVVRRGTLLLAAACLVYGVAGHTGPGPVGTAVAVLLLVGAELLGSAAEVRTEAGGWGLAFELADPTSAGAYQGLSSTGYALGNMVAPLLVTATAIRHGLPGWVLLAVVFAAAGVAVAALAGHAATRRTSAGEVELVA